MHSDARKLFRILLGCKWYGVACHNSFVPFSLGSGAAVHDLLRALFVLFHLDDFCKSCFVTDELEFREMS